MNANNTRLRSLPPKAITKEVPTYIEKSKCKKCSLAEIKQKNSNLIDEITSLEKKIWYLQDKNFILIGFSIIISILLVLQNSYIFNQLKEFINYFLNIINEYSSFTTTSFEYVKTLDGIPIKILGVIIATILCTIVGSGVLLIIGYIIGKFAIPLIKNNSDTLTNLVFFASLVLTFIIGILFSINEIYLPTGVNLFSIWIILFSMFFISKFLKSSKG